MTEHRDIQARRAEDERRSRDQPERRFHGEIQGRAGDLLQAVGPAQSEDNHRCDRRDDRSGVEPGLVSFVAKEKHSGPESGSATEEGGDQKRPL